MPVACLIKPALPARVELFLDGSRKFPHVHATRGVEDLVALLRGNGKDGTGLRETVGARKPATQNHGPQSAQLTIAVPPSGDIQLTKSRDHRAKSEEFLKIDLGRTTGSKAWSHISA